VTLVDTVTAERWAPPAGPRLPADASPLPVPAPVVRRAFKHPRLMHYNRLIATVLLANAVLLGRGVSSGWWTGSAAAPLATIALIAQANLLVAILPRQQWMINVIGWVATRPSTTRPLWLRWTLGKYYHVGGLHVGGAIAGTVWYVAFLVALGRERIRGHGVSGVNVGGSLVIATLFVVMCVMASPRRRARAHDRFEVTHRFCSWAALALVWVNTTVFVGHQRPDASLGRALLASPTAWLLLLSTVAAAWPWTMLRRVPVTVSRPSSHAAIVTVHHRARVPVGTTRAISRRPFVGWHHFANVPARAGQDGYRMLISRAGDWTADFIDDPPRHVWVRGMPAVGVANVKRLFPKVVYVVTGSGIGPALGHLLADATPARLVWVTRDPRGTYGDDLVDEVMRAQPDAVVWNTDVRGKPDVVRLAYTAYQESGADAVICISNKAVTWRVVHEFERRGIPAFGPIWDS
jgi:hypothetical protein